MALGRRQASARRAPTFDPPPTLAPHARRKSPKPKKSGRRGHAIAGATRAGAAADGSGGGKRKSGLRRLLYWAVVLGLWVRHRRRRRRRLGGRASAADPFARNPETAALDPDRRHSTAACWRRAAKWAGAALVARRNCRTICRKPSSPSRIAASTRISASTRSASAARSPPTCSAAACRRAARPSRSSSPRTCS